MEQSFEYYAFISYKSEDIKWSRWLQCQLENYRLPISLRKNNPDIPQQLKIFRDESDLGIGILPDTIKDKLDKSKFLIVICSPRSANKDCYVTKEIAYFLQNHPVKNMALIIVEGIPYSNNETTECFNPEIKKLPEEFELNAADVQKTGKKRAFILLLAYILGIESGLLWDRYKKYLLKKRTYIISLSIFIMSIISLAILFVVPYDVAIRLEEQEIHSLPFEGATVSLECAGKADIINVSEEGKDSLIHFSLHSKYTFNKIRLIFTSEGYLPIDTVVSCSKNIDLPLWRDDTYAIVGGTVFDFDSEKTISNATVLINDTFVVETDSNGYFRYNIPLQHQKAKGCIRIEKKGYIFESDKNYTTIAGDSGTYIMSKTTK